MIDESEIYKIPIRVHWHGWESNTFALRKEGWKLFAKTETPLYHDGIMLSLAIKSPDEKIVILGQKLLLMRTFFEGRIVEELTQGRFEMNEYRASDIIRIESWDKSKWDSYNSVESFSGFMNIDETEHPIRALSLFKDVDTSKEIIIQNASIDDCLKEILKQQYKKDLPIERIKAPKIEARIYSLVA